MKKILLFSLAAAATIAAARADEVALLEFKFPDKSIHTTAIEFFPGEAPGTVANFKKLVKDGFYKGCAVHRAFPGMLVQTGDPLSKKSDRNAVGTGGPGYTIPAEIRRKHTKGAVAAARLADAVNPQRHSNGSQFYICLTAMPKMDGQYTVFGQVIQGMDSLEVISNQPTDTNDYPVERIELRKITLIDRSALPAPNPKKALPTGPILPPKKPFWRHLWPW